MTKVVSLRIPQQTIAEIDRRAADEGLDRTNYLLQLVKDGLCKRARAPKRRFVSTHLLGKFPSKGSTNAEIRAAMKKHIEKDR